MGLEPLGRVPIEEFLVLHALKVVPVFQAEDVCGDQGNTLCGLLG